MRVKSQGFGKFSSICVLLKITSKRGYVKIFNSLHNCIGTLRLLIMKTFSGDTSAFFQILAPGDTSAFFLQIFGNYMLGSFWKLYAGKSFANYMLGNFLKLYAGKFFGNYMLVTS